MRNLILNELSTYVHFPGNTRPILIKIPIIRTAILSVANHCPAIEKLPNSVYQSFFPVMITGKTIEPRNKHIISHTVSNIRIKIFFLNYGRLRRNTKTEYKELK